jgi:hypothetical protein
MVGVTLDGELIVVVAEIEFPSHHFPTSSPLLSLEIFGKGCQV